MKKEDFIKAARITISVVRELGIRQNERAVEPYFFVILRALNHGTLVERQFHLKVRGQKKPNLLDLRIGGVNPKMIELAVQSGDGKALVSLYGSQNITEGQKLASFPQSEAKVRVLVLIDFSKDPMDRENLISSYQNISQSGRNPIRVIYIHETISYDFLWSMRGLVRAA